MKNITIVTAGLSNPSSSTMLAQLFEKTLEKDEDIKIETIQLKEHAAEVLNNVLVGFASGAWKEELEKVYKSDGLIFITPIYNSSYTGLFKLFIDSLDPERVKTLPVVISGTGGTVRHSLALDYSLRPVLAHLHFQVMRTSVYAASQDWGEVDNITSVPILVRVEQAVKELLNYTEAFPRREESETDGTNFLRLLGSLN